MAVLRDLIVGLTRAGCRVECVAHAGPSVVFRTPGGDRLRISSDGDCLDLARLTEGGQQGLGRYRSLDLALRAVEAADPVGTVPAHR